MTKEDKELLLRDLCARLSYHPIVSVAYNYADKGIVWEFDVLRIKLLLEIEEEESWEYIKPYLRPMSSMTDKELIEFLEIRGKNLNSEELKTFREGETAIVSTLPSYSKHIDWLNAHHFDYRGLIEKGFAIEVTKENNPYKG